MGALLPCRSRYLEKGCDWDNNKQGEHRGANTLMTSLLLDEKPRLTRYRPSMITNEEGIFSPFVSFQIEN
ncbi:hypothetical protein [Pseudomonas oryzihabitans]|uniref:hypothetical protein n=1 Tax=Pseudomonas oryzihabitans TaxID=47885 RepID=UPI00187C78EF|nr:hypothetical protein [Pseudomonas psychrotolerans]